MLHQLLLGLTAASTCFATPFALHPKRNQEASSNDANVPKLKPVVRWDRRLDDWQDLVPKTAQQLYFGSDNPAEKHQFADLSVNFTGRAVVLQHSAFVAEVQCSNNAIDITMSDDNAFNKIKDEWADESDFMLVTNSDVCGDLSDQFSFWDVSSLKFAPETKTLHAVVTEERDIGSVLSHVDMTWGTWIPGPPPGISSRIRSRHLSKRGFWDDPIGSIGSAAKSVGTAIYEGGKEIIQYHPVVILTKEAVNVAIKYWNPELKTTVPINVAPSSDKFENNPNFPASWKNALPLYKVNKGDTIKGVVIKGSLGLYCVDCYFKGEMQLEGRAEYTVDGGLTQLYAATDANFQAQFVLGLAAEGSVSYENEYKLIEAAIPGVGFAIDGVLVIGAFVNARVKYDARIEANGYIKAGVAMTECKFKTRIDLAEIKNSVPPSLEPKFDPIFEASIDITLAAGVSFPLAVGLGVKIPPLGPKGDLTVSVVEQPGVNLQASYHASTEPEDGGEGGETGGEEGGEGNEGEGEEGKERRRALQQIPRAPGGGGLTTSLSKREEERKCKGIDWDIKFVNTLYLDALGKYQFPLHEFNKTIADGCIPIGKQERDAPVWNPEDYDEANDWKGDFDADEYKSIQSTASQAADAVAANLVSYEDYPDDTDFIQIKDVTKKYQILQDDQGFLRPGYATAQPVPGSVWAETAGLIVLDYNERQLKYDPASMKTYGWSPIQLGKPNVLQPKANSIAFVPARTGSKTTPYVYTTVDGKGQTYALLTCVYADKGSRMFVAKGVKSGINKLKLAQSKMTGGKIRDCYAQAWVVDPKDIEKWA